MPRPQGMLFEAWPRPCCGRPGDLGSKTFLIPRELEVGGLVRRRCKDCDRTWVIELVDQKERRCHWRVYEVIGRKLQLWREEFEVMGRTPLDPRPSDAS